MANNVMKYYIQHKAWSQVGGSGGKRNQDTYEAK
jgi:hypothetical protein